MKRQGKPPIQINVRSVGRPSDMMLEAFARLIINHQQQRTPELRLVTKKGNPVTLRG